MGAESFRVEPVDERDSNWEKADPTFRVYVQSARDETHTASTATYDLSGVDVQQAIEWARNRAQDWPRDQAGGDSSFAVALVVDDQAQESLEPGTGRGLIWLLGRDANTLS